MGVLFAAIISFILNLFYSLFKFVAKIIKDLLIATKLVYPVLCAAVGGVLILTGNIVYGEISFIYFALAMSFCMGLTVFLWYRRIRTSARKSAKKHRREEDIPPRRQSFARTRRFYSAQNRPPKPVYPHGNNAPYASGQPYAEPYNTPLDSRTQAHNPYAEVDNSLTQSPNPYRVPSSSAHGQEGSYQTAWQNPLSGRFFRVKQNPNYIMRELPGKVELYEETPHGLKYIRTDHVDNIPR